MCHNPTPNDTSKWFARDEDSCKESSQLNYDLFPNYEKWNIKDGREIVFSWKFPLPRGGEALSMSPWHQNMVAVFKIYFDVQHDGSKGKKFLELQIIG